AKAGVSVNVTVVRGARTLRVRRSATKRVHGRCRRFRRVTGRQVEPWRRPGRPCWTPTVSVAGRLSMTVRRARVAGWAGRWRRRSRGREVEALRGEAHAGDPD